MRRIQGLPTGFYLVIMAIGLVGTLLYQCAV